jgi:hypothetical protein
VARERRQKVSLSARLRRNFWSDSLELEWARSATKHRISRDRTRFVIEHCDVYFREHAPREDSEFPRAVFLGDDGEGIGLEVVAAPLMGGGLKVIHSMKVGAGRQERYGEAVKWRE